MLVGVLMCMAYTGTWLCPGSNQLHASLPFQTKVYCWEKTLAENLMSERIVLMSLGCDTSLHWDRPLPLTGVPSVVLVFVLPHGFQYCSVKMVVLTEWAAPSSPEIPSSYRILLSIISFPSHRLTVTSRDLWCIRGAQNLGSKALKWSPGLPDLSPLDFFFWDMP